MASEIQRLNYHTGLFLEEEEFKLEQSYHLIMRRRLNYALFKPGVLYGLELDYSGGVLTVTPGLAVDEFADPDYGTIGREIVLLEKSSPVELSGFNAGDGVWITINYKDEPTDPKSPTDKESRITETYEIETHGTEQGEGTDKILLGKFIVDTGVDPLVAQQKAALRLGGAPSPVNLTAIEVEPPSLTIAVGESVQLIARGTFSDSSTRALTAADGLTWESNKPSKATVDANGMVTGVAKATTVTITARAQGLSATASVKVEEALTLVSIEITPDPVPEIQVGDTQLLSATGTFSDASSRALGPADGLAWSSETPAVASIGTSTGLVTGVAPGSAIITAAVGSITDITTVKIQIQAVIDSLSPDEQASGGNVDIRGHNIRDPGISPGQPATGTVVTLRKGSDSKLAIDPTARPNDVASRQVVQITIPDRSGTPWGATEEVTLELEFGGGTATTPFQYDD